MTFFIICQIQLINYTNNLTEKNTIFHIVIRIRKCCLDNSLFYWSICIDRKIFQRWKQCIIYKIQENVSCHSFSIFIMSPVPPATFFWNNGLIVFFIPFPILFFCIIYFQKEHPCYLLNTLCITIDTRIITHDISYSFYKI